MAEAPISNVDSGRVRFLFPSNWTAEFGESEDGTSYTLQSPDVTFAVVGAFSSEQDPDELLEATIETFREEHPDLEVEEMDDPLAVELAFFSLDALTYVWIKSWQLEDQTVLVMVQTIEPERELSYRIFEGICAAAHIRKDA